MGEFLILLEFSKNSFSDLKLWESLLIETIARRFSWVIKKVESGESNLFRNVNPNISFSYYFSHMNDADLEEFYTATKVGNDLLIFHQCSYKYFMSKKDIFVQRIDNNEGNIDEKEVENFIKETNQLKKNITSYKDLLDFMGLKQYSKDGKAVMELINQALTTAINQRYIDKYY